MRRAVSHVPASPVFLMASALALSSPKSDECDAATATPNHEDIEHICVIWAEVGRAILIRRQECHERV